MGNRVALNVGVWMFLGVVIIGVLKRNEITYTVENMMLDIEKAVPHPNVQKFLHLISVGEGTDDADGYRRKFGGTNFESFADHPRTVQTMRFKNGQTVSSSAAGKYQFLRRTWDELRDKYDLPDFGPASQDLAAVALLKQSGALLAVIEGRYADAIRKANKIWASLPESPYGQPTLTMAKAGQLLGVDIA